MIGDVADTLRAVFTRGHTRPYAWRLKQLEAVRRMIGDNIDTWCDAVCKATLKPRTEAAMGDVLVLEQEARGIIKDLKSWMRPVEVATPVALIPTSSRIEHQPYGVTLIIGPSNYPLMLTIAPLLGAIAAGNTVVIKPSESCPEVAETLEAFVHAYLDTEAIKVVQGGADIVQALLAQKWDKIIFTGSERVGRIVAAAAAHHLTPVTLELGGKCPVIIDRDAEPLSSIAGKLVAPARIEPDEMRCDAVRCGAMRCAS